MHLLTKRCDILKKRVVGMVSFAVVMTCSPVQAELLITLSRSSDLVITRQGPAANELRLASDLLERYLFRVLDKQRLKSDGERLEFVISTDALIWHQLPAEKRQSLGDIDAFSIRIDPADRKIHIHGSTVQAAGFGVLEFLERFMDITWLFPGELGLALPESKTFTLKSTSIRLQPSVTSRLYTGMLYPDAGAKFEFMDQFKSDHPLYAQRIFFTAHDYFKSLKLHFLASPSHNMINIVSDEMIKVVPEMAPLLENGTRFQAPKKRSTGGGHQAWHPCYSHPAVRATATTKAKKAFSNGAMCYSLGINDGRRVQCQCADCKKQGWPMSYFNFVTDVANAVKDEFPGHVLGVLVYGDVRQPPDDMRLPKNVLCMVSGASEFAKWSKHASHIGRYSYFFGHGFYVPSFPLKSLQHNARVFKQSGVRSFRSEIYPVWAFDGPKVYILSKQLWDLDVDTDALLERWCNAAFGEGGPDMKLFYLHWASKWDYLATQRGPNEPVPLCDMGLWRSTSAQFARMSPEDFTATSQHLTNARQKVKPGKQKDRLDMVQTHFDYSRTLFDTHHTVQSVLANEATDLKGTFRKLQTNFELSKKLEALVNSTEEWLLGAGRSEDMDSYKTVGNEMHTGMLKALMQLKATNTQLDIESLPKLLKPLASAKPKIAPLRRIKVMDNGWYYALPDKQHLFEPMKVTSTANQLHAIKLAPTPRISDGPREGEYEQHWSFALVPWLPKAERRNLFRFDFVLKGKQGSLKISIGNPRVPEPGDGLPVNASFIFGDKQEERKLSIVVEPVTPESRWFGHIEGTAMRFGLLFDPADENSECEVTAKISEVTFPHDAKEDVPISIEDFLEE